MEIVIDTSALIAVLTEEPGKGAIVKATRRASLRAPRSVHWEIGNAFSAMLKRKLTIRSKVIKALAIYDDIPIAFTEIDLRDAVRIADDHAVYACDAYILACAKRFGLPLLTLDQPLMRVAKSMTLDVVDL